jgi:hypothetical protein
VLAASAGCLGSAAHATSGSTETAISGTLRLSGGPPPGLRRLEHATVEVLSGQEVVATMTTDGRGRFRVPLPPGRYRFAMKGGPDLLPPTAVVAATGTTHISLTLNAR